MTHEQNHYLKAISSTNSESICIMHQEHDIHDLS
uniref:Uncharacterized protein n=1 Tax=Arundo donax TaxID=35708 RepID=A0A0A9G6Y9_ARUDO